MKFSLKNTKDLVKRTETSLPYCTSPQIMWCLPINNI